MQHRLEPATPRARHKLVLAAAKVNLALRVVGKLPSGLHRLHSVVLFADVYDRLELSNWREHPPAPKHPPAADTPPARNDTAAQALPPCPHHVHVSAPPEFALNIPSQDNLVTKAIELAAALGSCLLPGSVHIHKNIPVGAGLGGGSADAAAILRTICPQIHQPEKLARSVSIGADLPVCLAGTPAWVSGAGEIVTPIPMNERLPAVLVYPRQPLYTASMFALLQPQDLASESTMQPLAATAMASSALSPAELVQLAQAVGSSFERAARATLPEVDNLLRYLRGDKAVLAAQLSGSGSACVALCQTTAASRALAERLRSRFAGWWITPCTLGADVAECPQQP